MTTSPFNSPVECAVRLLALLIAVDESPDGVHPAMDLNQLVLLDHRVLHSGDFEGPPSLHPDLPSRASELSVKRNDLEGGLEVLVRADLATVVVDDQGFAFRATERGLPFFKLLTSRYSHQLRDQAIWAVQKWSEDSTSSTVDGLRRASTSWSLEFGLTDRVTDEAGGFS